MEIVRSRDAQPDNLGAGRSRYLIHSENLMMVVIDFKDGPYEKPEPPHSHPHEQISFVASGEVAFFLDEEKSILSAGDMIVIPPGIPHTIQLISREVRLVDAFHPVREDFLA